MLGMIRTVTRVVKQLAGITRTFANRSSVVTSPFTTLTPNERVSMHSKQLGVGQTPVVTCMVGKAQSTKPSTPAPQG